MQGVPLAAVTLEPPWQTHAYACTYVWSNGTFWDVPGFLADMQVGGRQRCSTLAASVAAAGTLCDASSALLAGRGHNRDALAARLHLQRVAGAREPALGPRVGWRPRE